MSKPQDNEEDPRPVNYRPQLATGGHLWTPRWITTAFRRGEITQAEEFALRMVVDETKGWQRDWVRLTRSDWASLLGRSERQACQIRDSLLEKGYLRRRKASEAPEAQNWQHRSGYQYAYKKPEADLDEIKEGADPETNPEVEVPDEIKDRMPEDVDVNGGGEETTPQG